MASNNTEKKVAVVSIALLAVIAVIGLVFLFIAGLTYLICLAFGLEWSWLMALGVWAACILVRWVLSAAKSDSK